MQTVINNNNKGKGKPPKPSAPAEPVAPVAVAAPVDSVKLTIDAAAAAAAALEAREAAATAAAAAAAAAAALAWVENGKGPAADHLRGEILAIIRDATMRHGPIDGARAVVQWLLRHSGGETATARTAMASEIGKVFRVLRKQASATKASVGLLAFIACEDATTASSQAGKAAAAALEMAQRRATIAGDKAAAAAAAAATLRPIFASVAGAAAAADRVFDREGPMQARNRAAAIGRLRHLIAAAAALPDRSDGEAEALEGAQEMLADLTA